MSDENLAWSHYESVIAIPIVELDLSAGLILEFIRTFLPNQVMCLDLRILAQSMMEYQPGRGTWLFVPDLFRDCDGACSVDSAAAPVSTDGRVTSRARPR